MLIVLLLFCVFRLRVSFVFCVLLAARFVSSRSQKGFHHHHHHHRRRRRHRPLLYDHVKDHSPMQQQIFLPTGRKQFYYTMYAVDRHDKGQDEHARSRGGQASFSIGVSVLGHTTSSHTGFHISDNYMKNNLNPDHPFYLPLFEKR